MQEIEVQRVVGDHHSKIDKDESGASSEMFDVMNLEKALKKVHLSPSKS